MIRRNVTALVEENVQLQLKISQLESEIKKIKVEKKIMQKTHRMEMRGRDRKEIAIVLCVLAFVFLYAIFAILVRGFV